MVDFVKFPVSHSFARSGSSSTFAVDSELECRAVVCLGGPK